MGNQCVICGCVTLLDGVISKAVLCHCTAVHRSSHNTSKVTVSDLHLWSRWTSMGCKPSEKNKLWLLCALLNICLIGQSYNRWGLSSSDEPSVFLSVWDESKQHMLNTLILLRTCERVTLSPTDFKIKGLQQNRETKINSQC